MQKKVDFILTAAGSGKRYGNQMNKVFARLQDKSLIEHNLERLDQFDFIDRIFITINKNDQTHFQKVLKDLSINKDIQLIQGGEERYQSVQQALKTIVANQKNDIIMVHDAARPCFSQKLLFDLYDAVLVYGIVAPILPITDTLRKVKKNAVSKHVDRKKYFLTQTPQCFLLQYVERYLLAEEVIDVQLTDEISYFEHFNLPCEFIKGEKKNLKITYPEDILLADFYLQQKT